MDLSFGVIESALHPYQAPKTAAVISRFLGYWLLSRSNLIEVRMETSQSSILIATRRVGENSAEALIGFEIFHDPLVPAGSPSFVYIRA